MLVYLRPWISYEVRHFRLFLYFTGEKKRDVCKILWEQAKVGVHSVRVYRHFLRGKKTSVSQAFGGMTTGVVKKYFNLILKVDHPLFFQVTEVSGIWMGTRVHGEMHGWAWNHAYFFENCIKWIYIKLCMVPGSCKYWNFSLGHQFKGKTISIAWKNGEWPPLWIVHTQILVTPLRLPGSCHVGPAFYQCIKASDIFCIKHWIQKVAKSLRSVCLRALTKI